jgi:hypothetical protein
MRAALRTGKKGSILLPQSLTLIIRLRRNLPGLYPLKWHLSI